MTVPVVWRKGSWRARGGGQALTAVTAFLQVFNDLRRRISSGAIARPFESDLRPGLRSTLLSGSSWRDDHDHLAAFHLGHAFDLGDVFDVDSDLFQKVAPNFLVSHFTAPIAHGDFHLVAVTQKPVHVAHLHIVVVGVDVGPELDLFNLDDLLLFARFSGLLLGLVLELAEIHDLADGRFGIG